MPDNTPSQLQEILKQLAAYCDDSNPDVQYDTSNKLDFNQAIDITAQNIREIGRR